MVAVMHGLERRECLAVEPQRLVLVPELIVSGAETVEQVADTFRLTPRTRRRA